MWRWIVLLLLWSLPAWALDETDLQTAIDAVAAGGTLYLENDYTLQDRVEFPVTTGFALDCQGHTIYRGVVPTATIAVQADATDTSVTVDDTSGFVTADNWDLWFGTGAAGSEQNGETATAHNVTSFDATSFTFTNGLVLTWPVGTTVSSNFTMIRATADDQTIRNCIIDGQRQLQPDVRSWKNEDLYLNGADNFRIVDTTFKNCYGNCIQTATATGMFLRDVVFDEYQCAAIHFGTAGGSTILRPIVRGPGYYPGGAAGDEDTCWHSEGPFTWSSFNPGITIIDGCFENVGTAPSGLWPAIFRTDNYSGFDLTIKRNRACDGAFGIKTTVSGYQAISLRNTFRTDTLYDPADIRDDGFAIYADTFLSASDPCSCDSPKRPFRRSPDRRIQKAFGGPR